MKTALLSKIENKAFRVGIIGLGYVGLPLLYSFVEKGFHCLGFDIDEDKVASLNEGRSYIHHISEQRVKAGLASGRVKVTTDFSATRECDGVLITVPTPLTPNREPDMSYIQSTCKILSRHMRKGQIVILESTTYPGTTDELVVPLLEQSGLIAAQDFLVAYSPEREDPNNPHYSMGDIPKVIGSTSAEGLFVAEQLYRQIVIQTVPVSSARVAEATKLLENIFRAVNIALINELKVTFMKMGIDIWEVIEAAKTKPFGYMPFYPGPGLGGHCIPIDPFYLTWKAKEFGISTQFIELAGKINTSMPDFVVDRVMEVLKGEDIPVQGAKILILGLAYKPNVDDDRESPAYYLMDMLEQRGADVSYNDPYIPQIKLTRKFAQLAGRKSRELTGGYDLILITTAHDEYRGIDFSQYNTPIVDTRNIVQGKSSRFHQA